MKNILALFVLLVASTCYSFDAKQLPITVVIPFPPGGGSDAVFRSIQKYALTRNVEMIPKYRPGADGVIGINDVNEAPKNGYTVGLTTAGSLGYYRVQNTKPTNVLTGVVGGNFVFVTHPNSNINTMKDLEKVILSGRQLNIGVAHAGMRSAFEQYYEIIKSPYKPYFIMYKGASQIVTDLMNETVDVVFIPITVAKPLADAGKLKLLATSKIQVKSVPVMTSVHRQWKDIDLFVFFVPPDTDANAVKFWNSFLQDYLSNKDVKEDLENNLSVVVPFSKSFAEEIIKLNSDRVSKVLLAE
jgi:tripartite-type tricarboxylate transporter receptor subunit TctC